MNTVKKIFDLINQSTEKFFIDIGASNVPEESQSEILIKEGWKGLMFECNPQKFNGLKQRMSDKVGINVISEKVTPQNIIKILKENNTPEKFFLSIDIDGYDIFVLEEILKNYKPFLIISEINEKIPPPVKFTVTYKDDYWWDGSHFYGYSISYLDDIIKKYDYSIDFLDYNNVIIVNDCKKNYNVNHIYKEGYLEKSDRKNKFPWNADFEPIYLLEDQEKIEFVKNKFKNKNNFIIE